MLYSISIQNFQSHLENKMELDPGVNILWGSSDSGKSAVIRSLNWLISNKPQGDYFRSDWGGDTSVIVQYNDHSISRIKTKSKNQYLLDDEVYEGFGQEVPEQIKNVLNFEPLNFQYQLDGPFLLSKTGGEVNKYLNNIVNLESIDESQKNLLSMKKKTNQHLQFLQSQLDELNFKKSDFNSLPEIDKLITKAETTEEKIKTSKQEEEELSQLVNLLEENKEKLSEIDGFTDADRKLAEKGLELLSKISDYQENKIILTKLCNNIHNKKVDHQRIEKYIEELQIKYKKMMPRQCPLCNQKIK